MKILVTGATGFIGRHVVSQCLDVGHEVVACASKEPRQPIPSPAKFIVCDISKPSAVESLGVPDALIHLAWPGLSVASYPQLEANYTEYLPASRSFLQGMLQAGLRHLIVSGTCFEYGLQREGMLSEQDEPTPDSSYAKAKNQLRLDLTCALPAGTCLQWARIFYAYGPGQPSRCLLPLLENAIERGDAKFPMSPGQHARDFIHVKEIAAAMLALLRNPRHDGIFNICSGKPTKVIDLVKRRIRELGADIKLDTSAFPHPSQEAQACWGDVAKLDTLTQ